MPDEAKTLPDLECKLPELRTRYESALKSFLSLERKRSKKEERVIAFEILGEAGIAFFNAHDRVIAVSSLRKADHDATWYTDRVETAVNLLETIHFHYKTLFAKANELAIDEMSLKPSLMSFANIQRVVKVNHPDIAQEWRDRFYIAGLPTHGFDKDGVSKRLPPPVEWRFFILGSVFLAFALLLVVWAFAIGNLSNDQRFILLWVFPIAGAFISKSFSGKISATTKHWSYGLMVAATGGFAVWLVTYFMLKFATPTL